MLTKKLFPLPITLLLCACTIALRAEEPGKIFMAGESFLHLGGGYLVVDGLYFRNGYSREKKPSIQN
jgi:hypothetical protein